MAAGFVPDVTGGPTVQSEWIEGEPRPAFFGGLKMSGTVGYPIVTYRCTRCGYLESFAPMIGP